MNTLFAITPDGKRIAYDRNGSGPAVLLLHGGGGSRLEWHHAGYVNRLRDHFTVITIDLRGHGDSDLPTEAADYTTDKMCQDFLAVADAWGIERFILWGMSYGGKIGRYLAVQSERVSKFILMGTPLGLGVSGQLRQDAIDFCAHWPAIIQAQEDGTLELDSLSQHDRDFLRDFKVPVMLGWVKAMLDWPTIEPAGFHCPTLWLMGSEDRHTIDSFNEYQSSLKKSMVQIKIFPGLDHEGVFNEINQVYPSILEFMQSD
jgi:pimeloyl-ACP methyl ester carboxylesterase